MISTQRPQYVLSDFLAKVSLVPNFRFLDQTLSKFLCAHPCGFPFEKIQITDDFTRRALLASERLRRMDTVPEALQQLMKRIQEILQQGLRINPVLAAHLHAFHKTLADSRCNQYMAVIGGTINFADLYFLIGSDWGTNSDHSLFSSFNPLETLKNFYRLIPFTARFHTGVQSDLWIRCHLSAYAEDLTTYLHTAKEGSLPRLSQENLASLKESGLTYYCPIGYVGKNVFCISLLAVNYTDAYGYRLRLLISDGMPILAAGDELDYFCPEVIWDDLCVDQLTDPDLWEPLLEAATLIKEEYCRYTPGDHEEYLVLNSTHLVTWLSQKLGKLPRHIPIGFDESQWDKTLKNSYFPIKYVSHSLEDCSYQTGLVNKNLGMGALFPTGKQIKRPIFYQHLRKFVHLLALDTLPTKNDLLLYKAEMRLMILIGSYRHLKSGLSNPAHRGNFLRMLEQSFGKVTAPLETALQSSPTDIQKEAALTLMVTLLDLKHRIADFASRDQISSIAQPLYPSANLCHRLTLSSISWRPVQQTVQDAIRLDGGVASLPHEMQWTFERFPALFESLETWYHILLDAKNKCEPVELLMMAHRNVFSKLPIPTTAHVEETFPDELSEGLQVGTLLTLKRICSLIASEVYTDPLVPPLFIADMTRAYRFSVELYRKVNEAARHIPISWYCLYQYLNSRHSFHVPGEITQTLNALEASFATISPTGYQRPSEEFKEIPLFFYSWEELPKDYRLHREAVIPHSIEMTSIEEVISTAALADTIGLSPEETAHSKQDNNNIKWMNSFGNQCIIILDQLAQIYTMSVLATTEAHRQVMAKKEWKKYLLGEKLGPEDHFLLAPTHTYRDHTTYSHHFGRGQSEYCTQVLSGITPMSQRMVILKDPKIREVISRLPVQFVQEWQNQADLLKIVSKGDMDKAGYPLHQAASGPSELSLDVLLEYFESHPTLLFSADYRSYFWAILRSAHVLESACSKEPLLLRRIHSFIEELFHKDRNQLAENALYLERVLWLVALTRHLCQQWKQFQPLLQDIHQCLCTVINKGTMAARIAPHLIVNQQLLPIEARLPFPELGSLFLLVGRQPPNDPNDAMLWLEVCEAMQTQAPLIMQALLKGDKSTRRSLWRLILSSETDIEEVMQRRTRKMPLTTLVKISAEMHKLALNQKHLEGLISYWKNSHWRDAAWREQAAPKALIEVIEASTAHHEMDTLSKNAEQLLCFTPTSLLVQVSGRIITVDWETGRIAGEGSGKLLPIYLRKHPDLALLGALTKQPVMRVACSDRVCFVDHPSVMIDIGDGAVWLKYEEGEFRLVPCSQLHAIGLPYQLREGFSLWLNCNEEDRLYGLLAAHGHDGIPRPCFSIDRFGEIHPLSGNTRLRLGKENFYPEADFFNRWGLSQKHLLVWLDEASNVAEIHLPLHNVTRVVRMDNGQWMIDGLAIQLEDIKESIPAFAGHSVYLLGKNHEGQRLLLLTSVSPYEIDQRRKERHDEVDWNLLLAHGGKERIHQYRLMPTGQVEGLTVSDNLLLMLWTLYMGRFSATAALIKRWLIPPGRPYTLDEERILLNWIKKEQHPSARCLRLFAIIRIKQHMRDFPSLPTARSPLWCALVSEADLMRDKAFSFKEFEKIFTPYDHELAIRLKFLKEIPLETHLYRRLTRNRVEHVQHAVQLTLRVKGADIWMWKGMIAPQYKQVIQKYPTVVQQKTIPIDQFYRYSITVELIDFFDAAYTCIKKGDEEEPEYIAILYALSEFREHKFRNLCIDYLVELTGFHYWEDIHNRNLIMWLILEQACKAKQAGIDLPELPSVDRRFGLATQASNRAIKEFFNQIVRFNDLSIEALYEDYCRKWFIKRSTRFLEQKVVKIEPPPSFLSLLKAPWSHQLTSEIERWRYLSSPLKINQSVNTEIPWTFSPLPLASLQQLLERLEVVSQEKEAREKRLLALANTLPNHSDQALLEFARQIHSISPCSIDECIGLALKGDNASWHERCPATSSVELQDSTLRYLEVALEEAHLRRLKKKWEQGAEDVEEINTVPHYTPSQATLPLMVAEYYSDCRLRVQPDQAFLLQVLTKESTTEKGSIIQAIMGSGKSKMLAPVWLQMMLGTGRLPIFCVPGALLRTTVADLQGMMWDRFKTQVKVLKFDRESCTKETLYALAEMLHMTKLEPTVFVCSPRDLHALQLMLKERHQIIEEMRERLKRYTLIWAASCTMAAEQHRHFKEHIENGDWDSAFFLVPPQNRTAFYRWENSSKKLEEELIPIVEESNLLQGILNLLQFEGALLVDEVPTVYDPRNLLSFPIGWQVPANPHAASMACTIYFEWLPRYFERLNLFNNMQSFSSRELRKHIHERIVKKAWKKYRFAFVRSLTLADFKAYLYSDRKGHKMKAIVDQLNQSKSMLNRQYAQELAFLKYALTTGLEGTLTSTAFVNYGRSKQNPQFHLAIPYECANVPKENTVFRRPWKTLIATCQYYNQVWEDPAQTAELIGFLQGIDPSSKDKTILKAAVKIWGPRFSEADLANHKAMETFTAQLDQARVDQRKAKEARVLIQAFLQWCVFPFQLKLDPTQMASTPQDIPMLVDKADAMGGTFGFDKTWNPRLARVPDHSSDATVLQALQEERNQKCHLIQEGGAVALLAAFERGEFDEYMALIDAGALFKGISNTKAAEKLFSIVKGFDCILFYDEEQRLAVVYAGGKKLLEHSDREGVKRALTQSKLSSPFAYYDQAHRIGTDWELRPGRALITYSNSVTQDDVLQSAMRCRGLVDGRHSIGYAIPGELGIEPIAWTGNKVIAHSKICQDTLEKKANFQGICEQLRGQTRAVIDRIMRSTADPHQRHLIHKAATVLLMENQNNDLVKTFGSLQKTVSSKKALKQLATDLIRQVEKVLPAYREEVKKVLKGVLAWHQKEGTLLPKKIRLGDEDEETAQEVDLSKDQDRLRLMEEEYERMLGTRNPKKETEWLHFDRQQIRSSPIGCFSDIDGMPALYKLRETLEERGFFVPFNGKMMISANALSTFLGESNCLFTENQKPIHRGLLIRNKGRRSTYVLVTEGDAHYLKKHLTELPEDQRKGIYLVEPSGAINQRGCLEEDIHHLWKDGTPFERTLLLMGILFQGSAIVMDSLPKKEVAAALQKIAGRGPTQLASLRILFETALERRPDDMQHYRRSHRLRKFKQKYINIQ